MKYYKKFITAFFLLSSFSYGASSPLKCALNYQSARELGTWRLTDDAGQLRRETNFGSKKECLPFTQATNGDLYCSTIILSNGRGYREVIGSINTNTVVAALPLREPKSEKACENYLSRQEIVKNKICVASVYDWKIMDLASERVISSPTFNSFEECVGELKKDNLPYEALSTEAPQVQLKGRPIRRTLEWMGSSKTTQSSKFVVGDKGLEVYLGLHDECSVSLSLIHCPNSKVVLPKGTPVEFVGHRELFQVNRFGLLYTLPEAGAEFIKFPRIMNPADGFLYEDGFVLDQP